MKRFLIVGAFALLAGEQALAADLPPPVAPPRAPAVYTPAPVPYYNWTGFYIGGNLGASWQQGSFGDQFGNNFSTNNQFTGTGGGQVGVNYEFSSGVVVGVSNQTFTIPATSANLPNDQFTGNSRNIQLITAGINYKFGGW